VESLLAIFFSRDYSVEFAVKSPTITELLNGFLPVFLVAFMVTLFTVPLVRWLAIKFDIVDHPDGDRKVHTYPIAYLGGAAVFAGIAAAMGKLGALIGVFMFEAVYISRGMDVVMYCCAVLAALGFALTAVFVDVEQSYSSKSWARARTGALAEAPAPPASAAVRSESAPLMPRTPSTASDLA
jgi:hypothetical protein